MLTSGYTHFYGINKAKTIEVAASKKIVFDANVTAEFDADEDTEVDDKLDAVDDVMLDAVGDVMLMPRLVPLFLAVLLDTTVIAEVDVNVEVPLILVVLLDANVIAEVDVNVALVHFEVHEAELPRSLLLKQIEASTPVFSVVLLNDAHGPSKYSAFLNL